MYFCSAVLMYFHSGVYKHGIWANLGRGPDAPMVCVGVAVMPLPPFVDSGQEVGYPATWS